MGVRRRLLALCTGGREMLRGTGTWRRVCQGYFAGQPLGHSLMVSSELADASRLTPPSGAYRSDCVSSPLCKVEGKEIRLTTLPSVMLQPTFP